MIGAYQVTFNKRALFICKTITQCQGYFIRKQNWVKIFNDEDFEELTDKIKVQISNDFSKNVKDPLLKQKMRDVKKYEERNDYDTVIILQEKKRKQFSNSKYNQLENDSDKRTITEFDFTTQ